VKKIRDKAYQCEGCGNVYPTVEKAVQCESEPISPFKYEVGDIVLIELKPMLPRTRHVLAFSGSSVVRGVVKGRWISGFSERDKMAHRNMYKVHVLEKFEGVIACRSEDQIIGKA
jgi:hypothetical protein